MNRLQLNFECKDHRLAGTIDTAPGKTGLLIVTGGNEVRAGAYSGQASLAHHIAKAGFPVFRFDRRGVGDSEGENRGFRKSEKDLRAALEAFRAISPQLERVVGFGNCDAASALMLAGGAGCDSLVLSNPWTIEADDGNAAPPPEAIRARYIEKLKNPAEVLRLVKGGVDLRKLGRGLIQASKSNSPQSTLAHEMADGIAEFEGRVTFLLATADRTAQVFESNWDNSDPRIRRCDGAGHSYVEPHARVWLRDQILEALRAA